jgi:hypothetical protein
MMDSLTPTPSDLAPAAAPVSGDEALVAAFEQRVLTRDEPRVEPLRFDAASVQARLARALRPRLGQDDPRRLHALAVLCYGFLAAPVQLSTDAALVAALGRSASGLARTWRELRDGGLVERHSVSRQRGYRLTRAGEDWLLAVVKGEDANG